MFTLIENAEIYGPEPVGRQSILVAGGKIARIGEVNSRSLASLGVDCVVIDAAGCYAMPGLIDPHQHIIGAGGDEGFSSRTLEVRLTEIVEAGVTTVVGLLGTDNATRHISSLLGKAQQLDEDGITTYVYTGGFKIPPCTVTGSVTDDLVLIEKCIGVGELAIADNRSVEPTVQELARLVSEAVMGGTISGKAGIVHFHTGPGNGRLDLLHELLDRHNIPPRHIYATHITRSEALMDSAVRLAKRGAYVDIDTIEGDLGKWLLYYREHDGPASQLTVSSDAHASTPVSKLYEQFKSSVLECGLPLEDVLPHFTINTATALKLESKGRLKEGADADVLIANKETLEVVHLFARGRQMVDGGTVVAKSRQEELFAHI